MEEGRTRDVADEASPFGFISFAELRRRELDDRAEQSDSENEETYRRDHSERADPSRNCTEHQRHTKRSEAEENAQQAQVGTSVLLADISDDRVGRAVYHAAA